MRVLITGGAGFVGANLAVALKTRHDDWDVLALDNLRRRGSELNVHRLGAADVSFVHGDVRNADDLGGLGPLDAIVECSAEPSVIAGLEDGPGYVVNTNLVGAYHCLELARTEDAQFVFVSTSRVYPIDLLGRVAYAEGASRFELRPVQELPGVSEAGISEDFSLAGARTLYGASKLAAELLIDEYAYSFGLKAVVNRCGVIAGPWQMGKVDQGVFTYWLLAHRLGHPLSYFGYDGSGKQVRDVLHIDDLTDLLEEQLLDPEQWAGFKGNVGGGAERSLSLLETTEVCRELTGNTVPINGTAEARPGDVPIFISDCSLLYDRSTWRPRRSSLEILQDINLWIDENEMAVKTALIREK